MLSFLPPVLIGIALYLLATFVIRRIATPIASVPGPFISHITSLYLKWQELRANRTLYVHSLHQKYGPVVRIGPNELSFTSWAAVKEIYCSSGSGYDKSDFYDLFKIWGRRTMFTTRDKYNHAKRKRLIADRYANSNVMRDVSMTGIQERSAKFVERCRVATNSTPDIFKADEEMMHQVAGDDSLQSRLIAWYVPTIHSLLAKVIHTFYPPRQTPLADDYVLSTAQKPDPAQFTLLSRLEEKSGQLEGAAALDHVDVAAECLDHMVAGIDTTGDALCFLMWELSQPRSLHFQKRLQEELRKNSETPLDQLPYLDAVVNEGLRVFPAIPMSLPRIVPQDGRGIDGVWVPEGTIVSCQAHSVHRINSHVFPNPDVFDPERWLKPDGDAERRRLLFAFANGGRGCVGKQ
ncbi:cytochrome p450 domain-containing protein [Sarocladium implicatum]|nr:cytochrome p450 domain-containing protein [Sarocladium implicatum]